MKKKSTAEYAETAELFLCKDKKYKSFFGYEPLFAFRILRGSRQEDERRESRERRERSLKALGRFDLPGRVRKRAAFPPASRP